MNTLRDHLEILDALIRLYEAQLMQVHKGGEAVWESFGAERQTIINRWQVLTPLTEVAPDDRGQAEVRARMERLSTLNRAMVVAVERAQADINRRIGAVHRGRRGLAGYRRALGPSARSQLGRG